MAQKLQLMERELRHAEEILLRSSPSRQLHEAGLKFVHLEDEFKKSIAYKLDRLSSFLPEIHKNYRQNMTFILDQKSQYVEYINKKLHMSDPKLQCRRGWAQTSIEGKAIELHMLEVNQKFMIQDASVQIEALCLRKI
jgi:exodeoxyribonuclease VII large subunit